MPEWQGRMPEWASRIDLWYIKLGSLSFLSSLIVLKVLENLSKKIIFGCVEFENTSVRWDNLSLKWAFFKINRAPSQTCWKY